MDLHRSRKPAPQVVTETRACVLSDSETDHASVLPTHRLTAGSGPPSKVGFVTSTKIRKSEDGGANRRTVAHMKALDE